MKIERDAVGYVQENVARFFSRGEFDPTELCGQIVSEALLLGAQRTTVYRYGSWWFILADVDWLPCEDLDEVRKFFTNIVPLPQAGANSMYCEVLATAFSEQVWTGTSSSMIAVHGSGDIPEAAKAVIQTDTPRRFVAFRPVSKVK